MNENSYVDYTVSCKEDILNRVRDHYQELASLGYEILAVFLQGSQNYGLDEYSSDYMSDVDTKAIILPSFESIALQSSPTSYTHVRSNNEHIDIKDIRSMFDTFLKQNPSYLELLFTPYVIVNPKYQYVYDTLITYRDDIVKYNIKGHLCALAGSAHQKYLAMTKDTPHSHEKYLKYGYDPKELHHLLRLEDLASKFVSGKSYIECLRPSNPEYLMKIKKGLLSLEEACILAANADANIKKLCDGEYKNLLDTPSIQQLLKDLKLKALKQHIIEELTQ